MTPRMALVMRYTSFSGEAQRRPEDLGTGWHLLFNEMVGSSPAMTDELVALLAFGHEADRVAADAVPDLLLGEVEKPGQEEQEDDHLEAELLARLEMRLGRPHKERRHVLRVLLDRLGHLRPAVLVLGILDLAVAQRLRHGDDVAGIIEVVVSAGRHLEAFRRL